MTDTEATAMLMIENPFPDGLRACKETAGPDGSADPRPATRQRHA